MIDRAKERARAKAWREANPERYREQQATYRETNREARNAANRLRKRSPAQLRKYALKTRYGLTPAQWDAMLASQGGACAVCRTRVPRTKKGWVTDHDHVTGAVRGILCDPCNRTLGTLGDTLISVVVRLARFVSYLERSSV